MSEIIELDGRLLHEILVDILIGIVKHKI